MNATTDAPAMPSHEELLERIRTANDAGDGAALEEIVRTALAPREETGATRRRKKASSGRTEYNTPLYILDHVEKLGAITLDPCWNVRSRVRAATVYTEADDGLAQPWAGRLVFVNYPYGYKLLRKFVTKIGQEAARGQCREIVSLGPASTETIGFRIELTNANAVCLVDHRVVFDGEAHGAFFASSLFYYGPSIASFRAAMKGLGPVLKLRSARREQFIDPRQERLIP